MGCSSPATVLQQGVSGGSMGLRLASPPPPGHTAGSDMCTASHQPPLPAEPAKHQEISTKHAGCPECMVSTARDALVGTTLRPP